MDVEEKCDVPQAVVELLGRHVSRDTLVEAAALVLSSARRLAETKTSTVREEEGRFDLNQPKTLCSAPSALPSPVWNRIFSCLLVSLTISGTGFGWWKRCCSCRRFYRL